jgi:ABC-type uncharacterized transport system substrate-binding protein
VKRRAFIAGLGGAAAWPVVARAQGQANVQRIGYLGSGSPASSGHYAASFRDELGKLGYVEGRNVLITYRWAEGRFDQLPALINELLREKPDVIIAFGGPEVTGAIKSATARDPILFNQRPRIVEFAARNHLPGFYFWREFVELGGLISYGPNPADIHRRMASHVAKILKGAKPADLPVEQPTKFELVINLKAAKALNLNIPPTLLARADEVIE